MFKINNKIFFNTIFIFSILALFIAYFIQYALGHQPCNLCLIERIPYFLTIIIISISFFFKKYEKIYLILLIIIFVLATLISFYHFGIEQEFIKESFVCELASQTEELTIENLLKELNEKNISCKDVNFRILGLSLATINTIISLTLSTITIKLFINYEKNKQN